MIRRIVCQSSGQDNASYKPENHIGIFISKSFVAVDFVVLIGEKGYSRNVYFNQSFVCKRNFNKSAALQCENSTNSSKVETRTKQSCKILIDIL